MFPVNSRLGRDFDTDKTVGATWTTSPFVYFGPATLCCLNGLAGPAILLPPEVNLSVFEDNATVVAALNEFAGKIESLVEFQTQQFRLKDSRGDHIIATRLRTFVAKGGAFGPLGRLRGLKTRRSLMLHLGVSSFMHTADKALVG